MQTKLPILEKEKSRFADFLQPEENKRIIFSGVYGSGKTTFLEDFFNSQLDDDSVQYEYIRIIPTHYAVSANDDIFGLIKFDILIELLKKNIPLESLDLEKDHYLYLLLKKNWKKIGYDIIKTASEIGKDFTPTANYTQLMLKFIVEFYKKFELFKKETEEKLDEKIIADSFLDRTSESPATPFEENIILKLISKKINWLAQGNKKTVLVIDDLDRLDPEHIFRILNIFAAQFESKFGAYENRFGFDKIIIVCDIENIQSIFHHKYGQEVNFYGYIDKFCSSHIYEFESNQIISSSIVDIAKSISLKNVSNEGSLAFGNEKNTIIYICNRLARSGGLTLRSLIKFANSNYLVNYPTQIIVDGDSHDVEKSGMILHLIVLAKISGSFKALKKGITNTSFHFDSGEFWNYTQLLNSILYIASIDKHYLKHAKSGLIHPLPEDNVIQYIQFDIPDPLHGIQRATNITLDHSDIENTHYIRKSQAFKSVLLEAVDQISKLVKL